MRELRRLKNKVLEFVNRIGISYSKGFELIDKELNELILPCHLGVLFYINSNVKLFNQIKSSLNRVFDSFFFDIRDLGQFYFSKDLISKGIRREYKEMRKANDKLIIHPTNKFYQALIDIRIREKLGIIIMLTDLPIYSSNDDNIVFMFGETHLKHRCGVVSTLKLREEFYDRPKHNELFNQRVIKEIIHEVGHILIGSTHCKNNSCVMKFSGNVEQIDKKSTDLCENCIDKLEQIREELNF